MYDSILALKNRVEENDKIYEQNENIRKANELERQSAETTRKTNESERVSAEQLRIEAEAERKADEVKRQSNESARVETEKLRVNAENERTNAEIERKQAEVARGTEENKRAEAETVRQSAETNRVNAENAREQAEQLRVSAENLRVEAENRRDSVITKLREDLDANTKADGRTQRSLTVLWDLNKGISYRFENDNEKAYTKTVPSGAKIGAVNAIGGRTIVYNQLIDPSRRKEIDFDEQTKHFKYSNWTVTAGSKYVCTDIDMIGGHKYYLYATDKIRYAILYMYGDSVQMSFTKPKDAEAEVKSIFTATNSGKK